MQTIKFKPGDKVLIFDKSYGCTFQESKQAIKFWQGQYGIGWVVQVYNTFYTVGYTEDEINGDFYTGLDLKHFEEASGLEDELFEI